MNFFGPKQEECTAESFELEAEENERLACWWNDLGDEHELAELRELGQKVFASHMVISESCRKLAKMMRDGSVKIDHKGRLL